MRASGDSEFRIRDSRFRNHSPSGIRDRESGIPMGLRPEAALGLSHCFATGGRRSSLATSDTSLQQEPLADDDLGLEFRGALAEDVLLRESVFIHATGRNRPAGRSGLRRIPMTMLNRAAPRTPLHLRSREEPAAESCRSTPDWTVSPAPNTRFIGRTRLPPIGWSCCHRRCRCPDRADRRCARFIGSVGPRNHLARSGRRAWRRGRTRS